MPSDSFAEIFSSRSRPTAIRSASALISCESANVGPSAHGPVLAASCGRRAVPKTCRNAASRVSPAGGASLSRSSPDSLPPREPAQRAPGRDHEAGAECLGQEGQCLAGPGQQPGISVAARDWPGEDGLPFSAGDLDATAAWLERNGLAGGRHVDQYAGPVLLCRVTPLRTPRASFPARGSPVIYAVVAVRCPWWIVSWQGWQTTRVLRRFLVMRAAHGGRPGPGLPSWASLRIWWTCTFCRFLA
jgi:hypothetical protein